MTRFKTLDEFLMLFPEKPRKKITNGWNVICPTHDDHNPSLSVTLKDNKILLHCQAGCDTQAILKAKSLTEADLFLNENYPPKIRYKHVEDYIYTDEQSKSLFKTERLYPKAFRTWIPDPDNPGKWITGEGVMKGVRKVLYHLPDVLQGIKDGKPIFICAGEKDADRLHGKSVNGKSGKFIATTNPFGEAKNKWLPEYSDSLKGADCIILTDPDETGEMHVQEVAASLYGKAKSIKIIPPLEYKGKFYDVSDWFDAGGGLPDFAGIVNNTEYYKPVKTKKNELTQLDEPEITPFGQGHIFKYPKATIIVREIKVKRGNKIAEIDLDNIPNPKLGLYLNLESLSARNKLASELKTIGEYEAKELLENVSQRLIKLQREGTEAEVISSFDECLPPQYLVKPLVFKDEPTIVFGEKGVCKSYLALIISLCARLPWYDNPLGFYVDDSKSLTVLYLDWERSKPLIQWRTKQLTKGHDIPMVDILYRRCHSPLADERDKIAEIIVKNNINLIIIDSLGMAAGGDINSADSAVRFHEALRSLKTSSLIVAQTSKDSIGKKSVFGSTHFEYYASSIWEVKAGENEPEENEICERTIALKHKNCNLTGLHEPIGIKFQFIKNNGVDDTVKVLPVDSSGLALGGLDSVLYIKDKIYNLLEQGALSDKEIAEALDEKLDTTQKTLRRYEGRLFSKTREGLWSIILKN